ncbi:MAG: 3-methyl-2-oxobutanoate hydroxymethyltransferase, partial [Lentisphaeria bacterium]
CLTSYDAQMAQFADECGVHLILVGDSLGMTVLGYENTVPVTVEMMLHHTKAVTRGNKSALVVSDMPFMSYHLSIEKALENAARYLQEANADAVKIEGGESIAPTICRLVDAGVPVMAHIGLLPQTVLREGGYRKYGKLPHEGEQLLKDALAVEAAGAFAVVLEGVDSEVAQRITASLKIPTIGIAAGPHCAGQIQVVNDILGLFTSFIPKHTKRYVDAGALIKQGINGYVEDISSNNFFNVNGEIDANN